MATKKAKTFNAQVYEKAYKRLNLTPTQRTIFQRLLGFLIRNNKPFPYSAVSLANLTGYDKRTIFRALQRLEDLRLIKRQGLGKNRRFSPGTILYKIFTTVTNSMTRNKTTATSCHQNSTNRDTVSYSKTSSSLKRKNKGGFYDPLFQEYVGRLIADKNLGLIDKNIKQMDYDEWRASNEHAMINP
jgi:predicted transcriptional regulator